MKQILRWPISHSLDIFPFKSTYSIENSSIVNLHSNRNIPAFITGQTHVKPLTWTASRLPFSCMWYVIAFCFHHPVEHVYVSVHVFVRRRDRNGPDKKKRIKSSTKPTKREKVSVFVCLLTYADIGVCRVVWQINVCVLRRHHCSWGFYSPLGVIQTTTVWINMT